MIRFILPLLTALLLNVCQVFAQNPSTTFAPWKNNAKGAYSLIHDDFGDANVTGIENYADTIAYNRGVKFTFGAITGSCNAADWVNANRLVAHGHEIMNHTHNHYCAHDPGWCETQTWANYATELDQSTNLIQTNTNVYPRFFIWPYDLYTQESKNYLRDNLNYYGARGGIQNQSLNQNQLNDQVITDYMSLNFSVYAPTTSATELNGLVDMAITNGKWGIRETHGVNDVSWGSVSLANYRAHMDYLRTKMLSNDIWVATTSEVTTYKMQAQNFIPTTTYSAANQEIRINWNSPAIDLSDLRSDVTLNVNLDGLTGYVYIYQANTQITSYSIANGVLSFNSYPHKGEIVIRKTPWTIFPPGPFSISSVNICTYQTVTYEVPPIAGATFVWTYSGTGATINGSGNRVTIDYGATATSGILSVKTVTSEGTSPAATLNININTGYQTQGASRCGTGTVNLQVLSAGQYEWYDAASGGNLLSANASYQPTVSTSTTYYTQRKTQLNNHSIGKASQGATNLSPIWWFPSYAQRMTIQKTLNLASVKVWGTGISNATIAIVNPSNGVTIAQSAAFNCNANGTVVNVNITLAPGTYLIYVNSGNGQGNYEGNVNSAYTTAGIGTIENKVFSVTVNASTNILTVGGTINNAYGPLYDFKFVESIPDVCPRAQVQAIVNNTPLQPEVFTQSSAEVCKNQNDVVYTVPSVAGVTYAWSYNGTGFTLNNNGASTTANVNANATSGTISVTPSNACGTGTARTLVVTVNSPAATPGTIGGTATICAGSSTISYSVIAVPGVTYNWNYTGSNAVLTPSGASVSVNYQPATTAGNISVTATNVCGTSGASTLPIIINTSPMQPGPYTASVIQACANTSGHIYTVPSALGVTYNWSYSGTGGTVSGTGNSVSLAYATGATSGNVNVTASNGCGVSLVRTVPVTINTVPVQPGAFTAGPTSVCQNATAQTYTVPLVAGVSYAWTYSGTGMNISGSTNSIAASYTTNATSGMLTVIPSNQCGNGVGRSLAIVVGSFPQTPSVINGSAEACQNATKSYVVTALPGVTYNWTYSGSGATIIANASQADLQFAAATSGTLAVTASNSCGTSTPSQLSVSIKTVPAAAGTINGSAFVCVGGNTTYTVSPVAGVSYAWSYSGSGATLSPSGASVNFSPTASYINGTLTVIPSNQCGAGAAASLAIDKVPAPRQPINFLHSVNYVTQGDNNIWFDIPSYPGETYLWAYTGTGASWNSNSAQVFVNFSSTATSGYVQVKSVNSCGVQSAALSVSVTVLPVITGVQEVSSTLNAYPNPLSEGLYIDVPEVYGTLSVMSVEGTVLKTVQVNGEQQLYLSMNDLKAGVYLITITTEDKVYRTRVVKQ